jgi:hypothetical protein
MQKKRRDKKLAQIGKGPAAALANLFAFPYQAEGVSRLALLEMSYSKP